MLAKKVPSRSDVLGQIFSSLPTELYDPKTFITHAAWLDQAFAHCPIFPTAASRRSLGRVSVPVWLIILSDQLLIVALGSLYLLQLANQTQASLLVVSLSLLSIMGY